MGTTNGTHDGGGAQVGCGRQWDKFGNFCAALIGCTAVSTFVRASSWRAPWYSAANGRLPSAATYTQHEKIAFEWSATCGTRG